MPNLDRERSQRLMRDSDLDALILLSAEAFCHATGAHAGVAAMWRRAGAVAVLIPADPALPETAIVSDLFAPSFRATSPIQDVRETPIWVEALTLSDPVHNAPAAPQFAPLWNMPTRPSLNIRPETFDARACYRNLRDALEERGMKRARIGVELSAVSARDYPLLQKELASAKLVDATGLCQRLRAVKSRSEITHLRAAAELAETGIAAVRNNIVPGVARTRLAEVWREAVDEARGGLPLTGAWEYISVGADPWGGDAQAEAGDLIKVDVGCIVSGYTSDTGRTFVLGAPSRIQSDLYNALRAGFDAGISRLVPGNLLRDVHSVTQSTIRASGLSGYTRGHFGHGLGTGPGSEEWPFISASAEVPIEAGMVLAFECPLYVTGIGGLIIEDQVEITPDGPVSMNRLSHDLVIC